ncbi:MAG TPA: DUF4199 domain-containing protein, partial [Gemmatimonadaceae bacterium]
SFRAMFRPPLRGQTAPRQPQRSAKERNAIMNKTVWVFGLIAGGILSVMLLVTLPFADSLSGNAEVVGYASMVAAFLLTYFGVRSYRDAVGGGTVGFGRALAVGILITVVASACYVVTWEAVYFGKPGFAKSFAAKMEDQVRKQNSDTAVVAKKLAEMRKFAEMYKNPAVNSALTFLEPLPVGLLIALVTAGVLSRKRKQLAAA